MKFSLAVKMVDERIAHLGASHQDDWEFVLNSLMTSDYDGNVLYPLVGCRIPEQDIDDLT